MTRNLIAYDKTGHLKQTTYDTIKKVTKFQFTYSY